MNLELTIKYLKIIFSTALFLILTVLFSPPVYAVVDPLAVSNNRFGIHLISANTEEASAASQLVNSSGGDWGYITVLIKSSDRNKDKWQAFFNDLRRFHLIPLVRLATDPEGNWWKLPYDGEEQAWADFLDNLNWPTKNRYVIIYNEPNQAQEWGNNVDALSYAKILDKFILALKSKNSNFFVLNGGLDASAPQKIPFFEDEENFLTEMNTAIPGIFNKLDGWISHSYPNPGFVGSPDGVGRATVRNWQWELSILKNLGLNKNLPIFIAETGWKHAEGGIFDKSLPTSEVVGEHFRKAFAGAWSDPHIVAITPFLLNYQDPPFDHFSFKQIQGAVKNSKILGSEFPLSDYYPQFQTVASIPKVVGQPAQENKGKLAEGAVFNSIVVGEHYNIPLTFENIGQSIWGEGGQIKLVPLEGGDRLEVTLQSAPVSTIIEPHQRYTFNLPIQAQQVGSYKLTLALFDGPKKVETPQPLEFNIEVKSPVILAVRAKLKWKANFSGEYLLNATSYLENNLLKIILGDSGFSDEVETRNLLPDYTYDFTLRKPFYLPATLNRTVHSGVNYLDFGTLQPDISSAILNPKVLWKLLPFSN